MSEHFMIDGLSWNTQRSILIATGRSLDKEICRLMKMHETGMLGALDFERKMTKVTSMRNEISRKLGTLVGLEITSHVAIVASDIETLNREMSAEIDNDFVRAIMNDKES